MLTLTTGGVRESDTSSADKRVWRTHARVRLAGAGAQAGPAMARTPSNLDCVSVSVTRSVSSVSGRVASGLSPYGVVSFMQPLGRGQGDQVPEDQSRPRLFLRCPNVQD